MTLGRNDSHIRHKIPFTFACTVPSASISITLLVVKQSLFKEKPLFHRAGRICLTLELYCHEQHKSGVDIWRKLEVDLVQFCKRRSRNRINRRGMDLGAFWWIFDKVVIFATIISNSSRLKLYRTEQ